MGLASNLMDVVRDLEVAQGEVDNVHDAVLQDLADAVLNTVQASWPVDTGESLAGWVLDHPEQLHYEIANPVDYVPYVWANRRIKGPPVDDLWLLLILGAIDEVATEWTTHVSSRVAELLV